MDEPSLILIIAALFTSTLSGMMGMGGGILLLTVMMNYFPPVVVIPLHGLVQLSSNSFRLAMNISHLVKTIFFPAIVGAIFGGIFGYFFVVDLPENLFRIIMGLFILFLTWVPISKFIPVLIVGRRKKFFLVEFVATFSSLFVGATGPLLAPFFLSENLNRKEIVATKAGCQMMTHVLKILVFFINGFIFSEYLVLVLSMVLATLIGTYMGKKLLGRLSDKSFKWVFKGLISVLAIRALVRGVL